MLRAGITPFANDAFAFYAISEGLIEASEPLSLSYFDIEELNKMALEGKADLLKVSFGCLGRVSDQYVLLPVGSCLGSGNGPKIVARKPMKPEDLAGKVIGIPGRHTTAYLLTRFFFPTLRREIEMPYNNLPNSLARGDIDCALVIHESRFEMEKLGWHEVGDLYEMWSAATGHQLPLGGVVARRALGKKTISELLTLLRTSLDFSRNNLQMAYEFAVSKSFSKEIESVRKSIDLYVTNETYDITQDGRRAVQSLFDMGTESGVFLGKISNWLYNDD